MCTNLDKVHKGGTSRWCTTTDTTNTITDGVDSATASKLITLTTCTDTVDMYYWRHQRRQQLPQTVTVMPSATCSTFNMVNKAHAVSGDYDVHTSVAAGHLVPIAIVFGP
jgi:D-serine deaminase-like pyridoxal phosphate-dependent protein